MLMAISSSLCNIHKSWIPKGKNAILIKHTELANSLHYSLNKKIPWFQIEATNTSIKTWNSFSILAKTTSLMLEDTIAKILPVSSKQDYQKTLLLFIEKKVDYHNLWTKMGGCPQ